MGRSAHEILKVSEVKGIRLNESEEKPVVEYLVAWSDDSHDTWWVLGGPCQPCSSHYLSVGCWHVERHVLRTGH